MRDVIEAARRVVLNAEGTNPRHTRARDGGCRDDCIPCGIEALRDALAALDAAEREIRRDPRMAGDT